jgi:hypothetical protein
MISLFFQLPREIRDQIYTYALYDGDGLQYRTCTNEFGRLHKISRTSSITGQITRWLRQYSFRRSVRARGSCASENNQLKYVCKRLYAETRGLDLHYNRIVFEDTTDEDAIKQCTHVLRRCPRLREVAIKCSLNSFSSSCINQGFSTIMNECNARGDLLSRIYVPYWCQASPNFVLLGLFFLATLRADTVDVAQLAHNTRHPNV